MDSDNLVIISVVVIIALVISLVAGAIIYHEHHKLEVYENVIQDLNEEQKCMYQCSFIFDSATLIDNYKFCLEKCDRISERYNE